MSRARAQMIRSLLKGQRGGVAIITALGFLLFAIPLISGSLGLAETTSIDSRVKTEKLKREYCSLAVVEFFDYLMADTTRFKAWLLENDPENTGTATSTLDLGNVDCGFVVDTDTPAVGGDPVGDPVGTVPFLGIFQQRKFQTFKAVELPEGFQPGDSVLYTIDIVNRVAQATSLTDIRDTLPDGFTYDCNGPPNMITMPGEAPVEISTEVDCPSGTYVSWTLGPGVKIQPGDWVTLTFTVVTGDGFGNPAPEGLYCNEVQVVPGGNKTTSGKTAPVTIGNPLIDECPGPAVKISEVLTKHKLQEPVSYPYAVDIEYTIYVENIGNVDVWIAEIINLLPVGINYIANTCEITDLDCLTDAPSKVHYVSQLDRQQVTWTFNPDTIPVAPGQTKTISFSADAIIFEGNYWVDLLVSFDPYFPEKVYTWPTAVLAVVEVYTVGITIDGEVIVPEALTLWVQYEDGGVEKWNIY